MQRPIVRLLFVVVLVAGTVRLVAGFEDGRSTASGVGGTITAPPSDGITVVTTNAQQRNELIAWNRSGAVIYYDGRYDAYYDVDPSPSGERTVLYAATERLDPDECNANIKLCSRNVIEQANLTTGEVTRVYSRTVAGRDGWHDVDRIGPHSYLIADIDADRAFVYNTSTGLTTWGHSVYDDYDFSSGGIYPNDWTHINDVELLDDGRVMMSLRNHDQVLFVDRTSGEVVDKLGSDGDHDVLYEQHNPDYIPAERGGPAVVVADSENRWVVEYQRTDDGWRRTWIWQDAEIQWPRDADRLPNERVIEEFTRFAETALTN